MEPEVAAGDGAARAASRWSPAARGRRDVASRSQLGARGATVYVTGARARPGVARLGPRETIEETAQLVDAAGGRRHRRCAATTSVAEQVDALRARGRARGAAGSTSSSTTSGAATRSCDWDTPFWEHDLEDGLRAWRNAVETHLDHRRTGSRRCSSRRGSGLVIEVTDGDSDRYRGSLFYDLAKSSAIRLALAQASELRAARRGRGRRSRRASCVRGDARPLRRRPRPPGATAIAQDPHFALSETPAYVGRAVAALAPIRTCMRWSGQALSSWASRASTASATTTAPARLGPLVGRGRRCRASIRATHDVTRYR